MKRIGRLLTAIMVGYAVAWLVAYSFVMAPDYRYLGDYFVLGWSGGGELPAGIQLFALMLTLFGAGVWWLVHLSIRWRKRRQLPSRPT